MNVLNYDNSCGGCGIPLAGESMQTAQLLTMQPRAAKARPTISVWLCEGCSDEMCYEISINLQIMKGMPEA